MGRLSFVEAREGSALGIFFNIGPLDDMTVHKKLTGFEAALQGGQSFERGRWELWAFRLCSFMPQVLDQFRVGSGLS